MVSRISRCNCCMKYFGSKKELKDHINKDHRITNEKMLMAAITRESKPIRQDDATINNATAQVHYREDMTD